MDNVAKKLEEKGIYFPLEYCGSNNYSTFWDTKTVLDNKDFFVNEVNNIKLKDVLNLSDYFNYLCLRKLASFQEIIPAIKSDEDKETIQYVSNNANMLLEQIQNGMLVKFINCRYQEIFSEEYKKYSLLHLTLELIIPFQNGIKRSVFEYLAQNYNYLLIDRFQDFHKKFEADPQLFEMLFKYKNLDEIRELRFDCVFPIFITIWNGNNIQLKNIIKPIIENIIQEIENVIQNLDSQDSRNVLIVERLFSQIFDLILQIKHPKATQFHEYSKKVEERLNNSLKENGHKSSYEIPAREIIEYLKNSDDFELAMLLLTHDCNSNNDIVQYTSRLSRPSQGKQGLIDLVSSNIVSDDYFTHSHQNYLNMSIAIGSAVISALWHDKELFSRCL